MVPRYSLYLDPSEYSKCIREDVAGHWLKWVDVMDYIAYARAHGFVPPVVEVEVEPQLRLDMADDILPEDLDEDDDLESTPDDGVDIYDLITDRNKHEPIEL